MTRTIIVEPSKLEEAARVMDQQIADYQIVYNNLYKEVGEMGEAWKGADNMAFVEQIEGFKENFEKMVTLLNDYSNFLRESAKTYRATQEGVIAGAKSLGN